MPSLERDDYGGLQMEKKELLRIKGNVNKGMQSSRVE